jgi:wyosine [tRNA(Phe)-imidazoG37] synthetase (radical SAM superfamily)
LGQSLGIDPVPLKTCNWNCVYCQLGRTVPLTNLRKEWLPSQAILEEIRLRLTASPAGGIDWVTFVGSGEPTLHSGLGWLIRETKKLTDLPVAVITNGALLYLPEVRQELVADDAVLPSLDAGTADLYRRINRPHPETSFGRLVDGLGAFRAEYAGRLWLEVMLVRALNDSETDLRALGLVVRRIHADAVHINLPTRPPAEAWVEPADDEGLMRALAILGNGVEVVHPAEGSFDLDGHASLADAVVAIITRHPMRADELERTLQARSEQEIRLVLEELRENGRAARVVRHGTAFWTAAAARFPERTASQKPPRDRPEGRH